ncbi:L-type lectin-domain containing receptor kinase IX.1-like [Hibiscus syriacus]|nr:L-type lectin-domain containing receptor kinase IX.1-like [Hibiscus syriacus]
MGAENAENLCVKYSKHGFVFLLSILVHLSKAASVDDDINFSFTRFTQTMPEMVYESDASASGNVIQLTDSNGDGDGVGRATYYKSMHLWDNSSGNLTLADFTTQFSFSIDSVSQGGMSGDGLAFFLAPDGSKIPPDAGRGCLGLQSCYSESGTDGPSFVAVEFDTCNQVWDPSGMSDHIGIDLNNVTTSLTAVQWRWSDVEDGGKVYASISYDSITKNLSVLLLDADDSTAQNSSTLSTTLDLSLYLPEWVTFGFSGSATATGGDSNEMHTIYSWNFSSSLRVSRHLNTSTNSRPPTAAPAAAKFPTRKNRTWLWVVLAIAGVISALIPGLGSVWFFCRRRKYITRVDGAAISVNVEMEMVTAPRQFFYKELRLATGNFSDEGLLGEGGFGKVYLGFLMDMNCNVAVKRITPDSRQGVKEFLSEVKIISRLRHRNLVQLIGWCHDNNEFLIVYEFLPNKSLDYHLHREPCLLTWDKRYKIALGLASALLYLQEECDQCVLHRDIKSSNVLLDLSFNAKLGDFGLARLVEHGQGSRTTKVMLGTDGYIAPECLNTYRSIKESDIYSFGVVVLEIASGRKAIPAHDRPSKKSRTKLVEWVWDLYGKESLVDAADQRLYGNYDKEQMERFLLVGLACAHPGYFARPSITQVIDILSFKARCPMVPREMPLPIFGSALEDDSVASSGFISLRAGGCSRSQPRISGPSVCFLKDKRRTRSVAGSDMEAGQSYVVGS